MLRSPIIEPDELRQVARNLTELGAKNKWRGADPYDGLFGRWPSLLIGGRRRRQAIIQLHARSPIDFRRLHRREHSLIPKAPALFGQAALRLGFADSDQDMMSLAEDAMNALASDTTSGQHAWGYPWDTQTRWSHYEAGSPNIIATTFAAFALADAADQLNRPEWRTRAEQAAEWVLQELYLPTKGYFAYHQQSDQLIHNANLLGAALVHRLVSGETASDAIQTALDKTLAAQRVDGAWPYGDSRTLQWVDAFHTAYVLDALCRLRQVDERVPAAITRGLDTYLSDFFSEDGRAWLWRSKAFPEDSHSAGTALTVLTRLAEAGITPRSNFVGVIARRAAHSLIDGSGHAIYRRYRVGRSCVHYSRWCDAPVACGFAHAADLLDGGRP